MQGRGSDAESEDVKKSEHLFILLIYLVKASLFCFIPEYVVLQLIHLEPKEGFQ